MAKSIAHWEDPVNLVLGLWMVLSPWYLQHQVEPNPTWNAIIVGIIIMVISLSALFQLKAWEEWTNVVLGVWLALSPWILGFSGLVAATSNAVIIGVVVAVLALWTLGTDKKIGGWWSSAA